MSKFTENKRNIRAAIRFDKITTRSLKIRYTHLSVDEKKVIKIIERIERYSLEIDRCWRIAYNQGYKPRVKTDLPILNTIGELFTKNERARESLFNLEKKLCIDSDVLLASHKKMQSSMYGGSF